MQTKMMATLALLGCLILSTNTKGDDDSPPAAADGKAAMMEASQTPEVVEDLSEPDGVAIDLSDPDNWKVLARGTGTFQFNDAECRQDAVEEATLSAKAALARFAAERLMVDEQLDKLSEDESVKTKGPDGESTSAKSKRVKTKLLTIRNSAEQILSGLITLDSSVTWFGDSGEARVTLGQSEKTIEAVKNFTQRTQGAAATGTRPADAASTERAGSSETTRRKSKSDF